MRTHIVILTTLLACHTSFAQQLKNQRITSDGSDCILAKVSLKSSDRARKAGYSFADIDAMSCSAAVHLARSLTGFKTHADKVREQEELKRLEDIRRKEEQLQQERELERRKREQQLDEEYYKSVAEAKTEADRVRLILNMMNRSRLGFPMPKPHEVHGRVDPLGTAINNAHAPIVAFGDVPSYIENSIGPRLRELITRSTPLEYTGRQIDEQTKGSAFFGSALYLHSYRTSSALSVPELQYYANALAVYAAQGDRSSLGELGDVFSGEFTSTPPSQIPTANLNYALSRYAASIGRGEWGRGANGIARIYRDNDSFITQREALLWSSFSAWGGDPEGMYQTALHYRDGRGTRSDTEIARQWMKYSADAGHIRAQKVLPKMNRISTPIAYPVTPKPAYTVRSSTSPMYTVRSSDNYSAVLDALPKPRVVEYHLSIPRRYLDDD